MGKGEQELGGVSEVEEQGTTRKQYEMAMDCRNSGERTEERNDNPLLLSLVSFSSEGDEAHG